MHNLHEIVVAIIAFIVLVGVMVVVHEFGHFAVAKLFKVRVEAFSFGFGPRLFGFKYGDTDYKICLLPLGGYVKMTGENFAEINDAASGTATIAPPEDPGAFTSHPRWQRMLIGLAGPTSNFLLAFVLMVPYFHWFNEVPSISPIVVEWVGDGTPAAQAGIEPGDTIRQFDSVDNPSWEQIARSASQHANQTVPITVERGGRPIAGVLRLTGEARKSRFDLGQAGLYLQLEQSPLQVDSVERNSPADQAGLRADDLILAVDGHAFHSLDPLIPYLNAGKGRPVTLIVNRNGKTLEPMVVRPTLKGSAWRLGFQRAQPQPIPTRIEPLPLSSSFSESKDFCLENSTMILDVLGQIFSRPGTMSQLSGPVGIARMAGQAVEMKEWYPKFGLAAGISLNLGILNLLPFPILDGGMILLLLIESTIRRDIGINVKERIYQAAFVLLLAFFAYVIFNDFSKLPFFAHLRP
jgi:regulator of sigma E protease